MTDQPSTQTCPNCGTPAESDSKYCIQCGAELPPRSVPQTRPDRCEMIIGYLVPHRCDRPALGRCGRCGRGFCEEHLVIKPEGTICVACEQGLAQPVITPLAAQIYSSSDVTLFDTNDDDDDTFADLS